MLSYLVPKSLSLRFLFIIAIPTILTQLTIAYIFYHRHWNSVQTNMIDSLIGEIMPIVRLRESNIEQDKIQFIENSMPIEIKFIEDKNYNFKIKVKPKSLKPLYEEITKRINYKVRIISPKNSGFVDLYIKINTGVLKFTFIKKRIENPTTYIFILWMAAISLIFFILSVLFSSNQIRSIIKLTRAAEQFGKGREIKFFKPSGALEIRKASIAFLQMKKRIERQIIQRTEMLTGISHDLRTPLTRIKLQLALSDNELSCEIHDEIIEMERMINAYLDFVRYDETEKTQIINIQKLIYTITQKINNFDINIFIDHEVNIVVKQSTITRAVNNIIDNAIKYSTKLDISLNETEDNIALIFDDDGPGIPDHQKQKVFMPFYRIEPSRNHQTGGLGLGLSIVRDIVNNHGGRVFLDNSIKLGGLKLTVILPK